MAELPSFFDATQVEPSTPFEVIPAGEYKMQITASEMVENNAKTGWMLKLELEITDGPQAGRKLFDRLNLVHPNPQAVEIANRTLSAICHAVGCLGVSDSNELHLIPMTVKVIVEPRKDRQGNVIEGQFSNEVKGYKALDGAAQQGGGFQRPQTQQQNQNQTQQQQSQQSQTAQSGGSVPPWKRNAA